MKKIKYRVTTPFGNSNSGDVLDAYLVAAGDGRYLIYHPYQRGGCASIEICVKDGNEFVSLVEEAYINITIKKERMVFEDMIKAGSHA